MNYDEVIRRGGVNFGDEDFALFRCPHCRKVYLLEYEVDTVYLDPTDLSVRVQVSNNEGFTCVGCGRAVPGNEPWLGAGAKPEFGATWSDLELSGWEWAVRRSN